MTRTNAFFASLLNVGNVLAFISLIVLLLYYFFFNNYGSFKIYEILFGVMPMLYIVLYITSKIVNYLVAYLGRNYNQLHGNAKKPLDDFGKNYFKRAQFSAILFGLLLAHILNIIVDSNSFISFTSKSFPLTNISVAIPLLFIIIVDSYKEVPKINLPFIKYMIPILIIIGIIFSASTFVFLSIAQNSTDYVAPSFLSVANLIAVGILWIANYSSSNDPEDME